MSSKPGLPVTCKSDPEIDWREHQAVRGETNNMHGKPDPRLVLEGRGTQMWKWQSACKKQHSAHRLPCSQIHKGHA